MAERIEELERAIGDELVCLWSDFANARNRMVGKPIVSDRHRGWSIEMCSIAGRIEELTKLVGPTPWETVTYSLFEQVGEGWYERIHADMGVEAPVDYEHLTASHRRYLASIGGGV